MISSLAFDAVEFATGEAFLSALSETSFSCALIDMHMPGMNGVDVIVRMQDEGYPVPAIIITGGDLPRMRDICLRAGAAAYLIKPVERQTVFETIRSLVD